MNFEKVMEFVKKMGVSFEVLKKMEIGMYKSCVVGMNILVKDMVIMKIIF